MRALRCSPFEQPLLLAMRQQSVPLRAIAGKTGMHHGYTRRLLTEQTAEDALLWLIQVGLLRREVDGQGITDSFRLTPLGHQLLAAWRSTPKEWLPPSPLQRWLDGLTRWLRLPIF